jgi:1-deoxy-D-xylulose-5-phosphate synthase
MQLQHVGLDSLRQAGGLSGFPSPQESSYDLFATGHAGTAISTAAGLAWADHRAKANTKVVAIVGDASIVNGLSLEGLNNAALLERQFLIVLNDNSMAIDRTHGAMAHALDRIRTNSAYTNIKQSAEQLLKRLPMGEEISGALRNLREGLRTTIHGGQVFEALGIAYYGPADGHNVPELIHMLRRLASIDRPVLLHVHTQKGRGCQYAVEDPCRFHSPSAYTIEQGQAVFPPRENPTWTQTFSDVLVEQARKNDKIDAITAAMPDGTGLVKFREEFPDATSTWSAANRTTTAAWRRARQAACGRSSASYSTFMQRAMDQFSRNWPAQIARGALSRPGWAVGSTSAVLTLMTRLPAPAAGDDADGAGRRADAGRDELALTRMARPRFRYPRDECRRKTNPAETQSACPPFELARPTPTARATMRRCCATA